jgi:hypothetical protein
MLSGFMQYKNFSQSSTKKRQHLPPRSVIVLLVILVLGLAIYVIAKHHQPTALPTASQNTKGEIAPKTSASSPVPSSKNPTVTSDKSSTSTAELLTPTGDFVSNHHPNLSGSPAPNRLTSVCTTTPDASCMIIFTKDGVTKSLGAQVVDAGGSTYWNNWKLQDIGLTAGTWTVQAVSTLNGQTKTASDALNLVVAE